MNELLLKVIDNLPPLPETVMKLQQYVDSAGSDVQIDGVVDIISKDPLLTGDLLRLANSPYYGFSREISTLNQVVSLLGINNEKIRKNLWGIVVKRWILFPNGFPKQIKNLLKFLHLVRCYCV